MGLRAAILVILSALLHALWNALVKREAQPRDAGVAVLAVAFVTAVLLAIVPGGSAHVLAFPSRTALAWAVAAGAFEGAYFAALGVALDRGPLGAVYTVARGGSMLVAWPVSIVFLGERFGAESALGAALVGAGVVLAAGRTRGRLTRGALVSACICAACIAGYHLCYKLALSANAEPRALFAVGLGCALPVNLASLGRNAVGAMLAAIRRSPQRMLVAGVACTASFIVLLEALATTGAGAVLTLRNTSVVFAQGLAVWGGERVARLALAGAALVVAGAFLLAR